MTTKPRASMRTAARTATPTEARFERVQPGTVAGSLYRAVKRALLQAIEHGSCTPGSALPSEADLARAFGVSIGTVRHAVDELVAEHIVVRQHGRGTFVAVHNADRFLFQFFHVERCDGLQEVPKVELLHFDRARAGETQAAALGLKAGEPIFEIENRLLLQGQAVIHDRLALPASLYKGLTERRFRERPSTIYHLYQTVFAITVTRAHERARAVGADRTATRILGVQAGSPVMEVHRNALTFGDKPVEFRLSTINTARHDYVHLLSRPV